MSAIFGGGGDVGEKSPRYTGLQLQTSSSAVPISLFFGLNRGAPNLVWYDDFTAIRHQEQSGGKGGGVTQTSYTYSASLIMGLCEGPIYGVPRAWKSGSSQGNQELTSVAALGFTLFTGPDPQTPWSYLSTEHPDAALAYNGLAYLAAANYDLGNSASLPNHTFEIAGLLYNTGIGGTVFDADPALVVSEFLTNERWGSGFPVDMIDYDQLYSSTGPTGATGTGDDTYQTYCRALGLAMSPALTESAAAAEHIARWAEITNSAPVWDGSRLKLIPRGDENITANGVTFLANVTPQYDLTEQDLVADKGQDPILVEVPDTTELYNHLRVIVRNRADNYNLKPLEAKDQASIEAFGLRTDDEFKAEEYCSLEMGSLVAYLMLQRKVYIKNKYRFKVDFRFCRLEPMDVVSLTYSKMQLNAHRVRLVTVEEDEDGVIQCEAEDFPIGPATAVNYPIQESENTNFNAAVDPGDVNPPIIFEPSAALCGNNPQVWVAVSGAGQYWGGCNIWASTDNATFSQIGTVNNPCITGDLTASLGSYTGSNPDTGNTLSVDLTESLGQLFSTQPLDAAAGITLCYIGPTGPTGPQEVLSFTNATLTAQNEYDLTDLYRGLYSTTGPTHATGSRFARLNNPFKFNLAQQYIGQTIYLKFTSVNVYGQAEQALDEVDTYQYTPTGIAYSQLGTAVTYQTLTDAFSYEIPNSVGVLYIEAAGTLATGTLTLPSSPLNNAQIQVYTTQTITALTVSPNVGQSVSGAPTTLAANTGFKMVFRESNSTWYIL